MAGVSSTSVIAVARRKDDVIELNGLRGSLSCEKRDRYEFCSLQVAVESNELNFCGGTFSRKSREYKGVYQNS